MAVVLVTGGAGYIGSHACRALAEAGHEPIAFDDLSTGWREAVRFGPLAEGSLLDPGALDAALARHRVDAVMHFAAKSLVGQSVAEPGLYWLNNVAGSLALLEAMRRAGIGSIVFSSTAAVYGEPDVELIAETTPTRPMNPYGQTKLAMERMIGDFASAHGLAAMVFRYFNVAGAAQDGSIGEQHRPETHLLPIVLEVAAGRRAAFTVHGDDYATPDGTCIRDFVHVEDLVRAHVLGLERLLGGDGGGTVATANLGIGRGHSVAEVLRRAGEITGREIPFTVGPRRPGDPARLVCDPAAAERLLGWTAERTLDDMIADAWTWTRSPGYAV